MLRVHPVAHKRLTGRAFALRDFVFVVRKREIDAASVNVQRLAQILHGHRGAFDMPAGAALADGRFPEMLTGLRRFPQRKVARALFFVAVHIYTRTRLNPSHVKIRKPAVLRELRDAVIDRAFDWIGKSLPLEPLDQLDHVVDMVRGPDPVLWRLDAERLAIVEES